MVKQDFGNGFENSESQIGNPYLGIEFRSLGSHLFLEAGLRLPVVTSRSIATDFGQLADIDRFEAFVPDIATVLAAINAKIKSPRNLFVRLRGGFSFLTSTGEGGATLLPILAQGDDSELYLIAAAQFGFEGKRVNLTTGLTGRLFITEDGSFGKRNFLQLGLNARLNLGRFRPAVHFTIPLEDDIREVLDLVFGIHFGVRI